MMTIQRSLGYIIMTWLMAPFGTVAMAAHGLVQRVDTFVFLPSWALSAGAGVLVGQNLGARKPERAERSAWLAILLVGGILTLACLILLLLARETAHIFNPETAFVTMGASFLRIAAAGYTAMALVVVLGQVLSGAGDTTPGMIISVAMVWVVQVPLAFLLPDLVDMGASGVRWAVVGGTFAGAIGFLLYFRSGRWKKRLV